MKKNEKCYTNRELSWLQFNERDLNEAGNPRVPLAERMTFASIYQTNLDEFFMVRVGTLMMQMNAKEKVIENKTGMTSEEQVKEILARVCLLEKKKAKIYEQLMGELEPKGIRIINFNRLSNEEGRLLEQYFDAHIAPFLSPMVIGKQQPFPFLANKQLYAIVLLTSQKGKKKTGIVPCSNSVFKRLIEIPTRPGCFMLSEELILHFISKLYPKYTIREKSIMRVTRNADIDAHDLYDEDMDYRDMMEQLIKKRVRLDPVRVELSRKINDEAKQELIILTFRQDLLRTADIAEEVARIYGYDKIHGEYFDLKVNPYEAKIIRKMFDLYLNQGFGFFKIANFLKTDSSLAIDTSLVVSASTKYEDLRDIYASFSAEIDIDTVMITKMDETQHFGSMFSLLYDIKKPVSYFSVGQEVPEDLAAASSEFFVDCLLDGFKAKNAK